MYQEIEENIIINLIKKNIWQKKQILNFKFIFFWGNIEILNIGVGLSKTLLIDYMITLTKEICNHYKELIKEHEGNIFLCFKNSKKK